MDAGERLTLQLGMELATQKPRMIRQLDDFDQRAIWRRARDRHSGFHQRVAVSVVHFEAMTMTLTHVWLAVELTRHGPIDELARVGAESHRAAFFGDALLIFHHSNHQFFAFGLELLELAVVMPMTSRAYSIIAT